MVVFFMINVLVNFIFFIWNKVGVGIRYDFNKNIVYEIFDGGYERIV